MAKYYKAEDVINTLADQWRFEAETESPYATADIEEWQELARELFADLPTIEVSEDNANAVDGIIAKPSDWNDLLVPKVSEDCISRKYLEDQLQQIEDITAMAHIDLGENPYDETEEITMPISTVRKIFKNAPSVIPSKDDSGTARLDFVKNTIETHIDDASHGLFFTRNFAGDSMTHIDKQFGIDIEICYEYGYFEIFGLTDYEQKVIESFYDGLSAARRNK